MSIYYADDAATLLLGDALTELRGLKDGSADCVVTSPPYFGLRDYGIEGQYGLERTPAEYVEQMHQVFAEIQRVLAADGTLWLNVGDSYSTAPRGSDAGWDKSRLNNPERVQKAQRAAMRGREFDRPFKSMLGIPWRLAFALQDDGWILRNDIIWSKPNAMPESVTDRLSVRHEHLFLLTKSRNYWFDLDAIREERKYERPPREDNKHAGIPLHGARYGPNAKSMNVTGEYQTSGRNPGDVWTLPTQPFPEAHFACMPLALAERCILAGCKPAGVVLDPFSGSGTTGAAAAKHGRRYVGIDLNPEYLELSLRTRLAQSAIADGAA